MSMLIFVAAERLAAGTTDEDSLCSAWTADVRVRRARGGGLDHDLIAFGEPVGDFDELVVLDASLDRPWHRLAVFADEFDHLITTLAANRAKRDHEDVV